jgi:hypothetical protein
VEHWVLWLRGLDLNQRPLGYAGDRGRDGYQARLIDFLADGRLHAAWLGWVGAGRRAFTDNSRTQIGRFPHGSPRIRAASPSTVNVSPAESSAGARGAKKPTVAHHRECR